MKTITFIGNGNMAFAIANGLKNNFIIEVVGKDLAKLDEFEQKLNRSIIKHRIDDFDITNKRIILCVKPANLQDVSAKITGEAQEFYSVLAGTKLEILKQHIKSKAYIRAMPNLAASVNLSMTTITGDKSLQQNAQDIFNSIGKTIWVDTQKELDIATALAGSGPAYLALIHEALCDGAVKQGMKRSDAIEVANGLFEGFAKLINTTHSAILKDNVMSPAGTTAAGYSALEKAGVRYGCISAIEEAFKVTQN